MAMVATDRFLNCGDSTYEYACGLEDARDARASELLVGVRAGDIRFRLALPRFK
jgi:hypothetical protein